MNKSAQTINAESKQQLIEQAVTSVNKVVIKNLSRYVDTDIVIIEQPLQITLVWLVQTNENQKGAITEHSQVFSITMRTPGNDRQLILGLLMSEGVIESYHDIASISSSDNDNNSNLWEVHLAVGVVPELATLERFQMTYSSCGLCGTTSLKSLELKNPPRLNEQKNVLAVADIVTMPNLMRAQQGLFKKTGGSHAAALFNGNKLIGIREDIGRHNAVDKLFGAWLEQKSNENNNDIEPNACLVSGRVSFEIVQKTVMAGIAILIAVGAPSDLAILAAKRFNLTLIGFTSEHGFNIYHGEWRLLPLEE